MKILDEKRDNQQDVYPAKLSRVYVNSGGYYMIMLAEKGSGHKYKYYYSPFLTIRLDSASNFA